MCFQEFNMKSPDLKQMELKEQQIFLHNFILTPFIIYIYIHTERDKFYGMHY